LAGALMSMGFQALLVAFLADVIAANRKLLEDIRYTQRSTQGDGVKIPTRDRTKAA
ncbi:glycosyltransferase family 2 protein, partial [Mesorhizobium sp. M2E.F.Ca.ET.166.01.1.1]